MRARSARACVSGWPSAARSHSLLVAWLLASTACGGGGGRPAHDAAPDGKPATVVRIALDDEQKLDLLIDVDTRLPEPNKLESDFAARFDALITDIYGARGHDLQVAVIDGDLGTGTVAVTGCTASGDGAKFLTTPSSASCTGPMAGDTLLKDGPSGQNFAEATIGDALSCILPTTQGCVYQQPLAAAAKALSTASGAAIGFPRPDASLALLVLVGGEDCSTTDPALFDPTSTVPPSFRCFDDGVTCGGAPDNTATGPRLEGCIASPTPSHLTPPMALTAALTAIPGVDAPRFLVATLGAGANDAFVDVEKDMAGNLEVVPFCTLDKATNLLPSFRAAELLDELGERGSENGVCGFDESLDSALPALADSLSSAMSLHCLPATVDGTSCSARLVESSGSEIPLPRCAPPLDAGVPADMRSDGVIADGARPDAGAKAEVVPLKEAGIDAAIARDGASPSRDGSGEAGPPDAGPTMGCAAVLTDQTRCPSGRSVALLLAGAIPPPGTELELTCR